MATNDQNGVTENTCGSENDSNTTQERYYTEFEVACLRDGHEARVNSLTRGYERKFTDLKAECAAQVAKVVQGRKSAIDAAEELVRNESAKKIHDLENELRAQHNARSAAISAQSEREKEIMKLKDTCKMEKTKADQRVANLKRIHANELEESNKRVAVQVQFHSLKRKTRTYLNRASSHFVDATAELRKSIQNSGNSKLSFTFKHNEKEIKDWTLTLEQLGIKDDDAIWYVAAET